VEQNYIDSARNGIFKSSGTDAMKMEQLSRAADTISDMDMAGSALRGQDMHWELLPMQVPFFSPSSLSLLVDLSLIARPPCL
jgi:hypothetical protein